MGISVFGHMRSRPEFYPRIADAISPIQVELRGLIDVPVDCVRPVEIDYLDDTRSIGGKHVRPLAVVKKKKRKRPGSLYRGCLLAATW